MITKQQALEFIYELSKIYGIRLNLTYNNGYLGIDDTDDYKYSVQINSVEIEEIVTAFIKKNLHEGLFPDDMVIPVDIDMLEVGQTYKVHVQTGYQHRIFTEKFFGFDEEDSYVLKFENSKCNKSKPAEVSKYDIREIYKVVE